MVTDLFDIIAGALQRDMLAPYLFLICLDDILWISIYLIKENGFTLKKARSRQYPAETIIDSDYTDDLALLTNAPAQAKYTLHNL